MACVLITDIIRAANDAHHDWKNPEKPDYTRKMSKPRAWWSHAIVYEPVYKLTTRIERKVNPDRLAPYTPARLELPEGPTPESTAPASPVAGETSRQSYSPFSACSSRRLLKCSRRGITSRSSCSAFADVPPAHAVDTYRHLDSPAETPSPSTPTENSSLQGCSELELELCGLAEELSLQDIAAAYKASQDPPPPYPGPPRLEAHSPITSSPISPLQITNLDAQAVTPASL